MNDKKKKKNFGWITKVLSVYFDSIDDKLKREYVQPINIVVVETDRSKMNNNTSKVLNDLLNRSSLDFQWRMLWPYLKLVDRVLHIKSSSYRGDADDNNNGAVLDQLQKPVWDNYETPAHYLKLYLESNPYCCLLYKKYKEYQLTLKSHYDKRAKDDETMTNYQSFLSTFLILLVRLTFLDFESKVITSMILNLELGHQSVHLFTKQFREDESSSESKQEYWHLDWNLIHSMLSLIIDSRSYNPMMQLERIAKNQLKLAQSESDHNDQDYRIMAMEFNFEDYQLTLWQTNNTLIRWHWIDWHAKNVQWIVPLFE